MNMVSIAVLICRDSYTQVLDMLKNMISNIVIIEKLGDLGNISDTMIVLLSLGCCIEYEKLVKLVNLNTVSSVIEYCPIIREGILSELRILDSNNFVLLYSQPIIGTIRTIIGRSQILLDSIKTIRVILNYNILNDIICLYENAQLHDNVLRSRKTLIDYIKNAGTNSGIKQLEIQLSSNDGFVEVIVEGIQSDREKKLIYRITRGDDINQFMVAEIYSYIQLIINRIVDNGVLIPEDIGREEGLFTYYMGMLLNSRKVNLQVNIETIN